MREAYLFDGPQKDDLFRFEPAPIQNWTERHRGDQVLQAYRQEYKRRFAWIKAGKITEDQLAAWHRAARARKKDCDREVICPDEIKEQLKDS